MIRQKTSRSTTANEKTDKRPFAKLTPAETKVLDLLRDASKDKPAGGVTASGGCDLARTLMHNHRLPASDPVSQLCIQLVNEGWIVGRNYDSNQRSGIYSVSVDYAGQLVKA